MANKAPNDIVLFHYVFSPYARRIVWYLQLRGIGYAQCLQPIAPPRPDLAALGVNHRRIPVLSIGRDFYLDTRLILRKLEEQFPDGRLGAQDGNGKAIQGLIERFYIEGPVFRVAGGLIPTDSPVFKDEKFLKDREGYSGRPWSLKAIEKGRPENIVHMRNVFDFLESTVLADGRDWVLDTEKPSLADIEAIWPLDWLLEMKGALPRDVVSEKQFPKVFAWIQRFRAAVSAAKSSAPKVVTLESQDAVKFILSTEFAEPKGAVDATDPLGLKPGTEVEIYPTDSGFTHRDHGRLETLTSAEVTVATKSQEGNVDIRIHAPRTGFRIEAGASGSRL